MSEPAKHKEAPKAPANPNLVERTLRNLSSAWRDAANSAARTIGLPEPLLPPTDRRALKRFMRDCLEARGGEVSARLQAAELGQVYLEADEEGRRRFLEVLAEDFGVDEDRVAKAVVAFSAAKDAETRLEAEQKLRRALVPDRRRLLTKFNALNQGVKFLVDLRADLLPLTRSAPSLKGLDADLKDLLEHWFDFGFLDLRPITWNSPASLLEKLIAYEAVHEIRSWDDLRNRLDSDRRCYALFHPRMPDEPLAFVEVALVVGIAGSVQALLDEDAPLADPAQADTAIFYSISNTQKGLTGISFGEYLIKGAVQRLSAEHPKLKTFATLSPVPGFLRWVEDVEDARLAAIMSEEEQGGLRALAGVDRPAEALRLILAKADWANDETTRQALKGPVIRLAAHYFEQRRGDGQPIDPVARFHLRNGARLERINWMGDRSAKGLKQSAGVMVNYRYDPDSIEANHEAYVKDGEIVVSADVAKQQRAARPPEGSLFSLRAGRRQKAEKG
ncbi:malonyl-CoA decarboxylase [Limibacillus halophilus]